MLTGIIFFILFAIFALLYLESFWSNTITLINVTLASLLALSFFEPAANWIEGLAATLGTYTYLWDYLMLWLLFCIFFGVMRGMTDFASRTRVKFRPPIEIPGRMIMALMVGVMMISFILVGFHVAPLPAAPFGGSFATAPDARTFLLFKPDQSLLGFLQQVSRGSLSRGELETNKSPYPEVDAGRNVFDPQGQFILKYRQRRADLEKQEGLRVERQGT
jgi:hypothetical protein